jgi:hypothetical protein
MWKKGYARKGQGQYGAFKEVAEGEMDREGSKR